jgi:hypothetical protein
VRIVAVTHDDNSTTVNFAHEKNVYTPANAGFSVNGTTGLYDFGLVHVGQTVTIDATVTNDATGSLLDLLITCPGTSSEYVAENGADIAPGDMGTVTVALNATATGLNITDQSLFTPTSHDSALRMWRLCGPHSFSTHKCATARSAARPNRRRSSSTRPVTQSGPARLSATRARKFRYLLRWRLT